MTTPSRKLEGLVPVGTITVSLFNVEFNAGVPTAIIYHASPNLDGEKALREFVEAYKAAKGAGVIVMARRDPNAMDAAEGRPEDRFDTCGRTGCVLRKGHDPNRHEDGDGERIATAAELEIDVSQLDSITRRQGDGS